ncbi:MAG: hypothetical protein MJ135_00195 [Oscillospiraceae bacterium]|nr:hypothetical protein [Oscillospiraceae bacterium]
MDLSNISKLMTLRQAWDTFRGNHPRFPDFLKDVSRKGIPEGSEVLISVTWPDGETKKAGIKVRASDLELIELLKSMNG